MDSEEYRWAAKLSAAGLATVLASAILASFLAPGNEAGQIIKFFTPLLIGILFGAKIYFNELEKVKEKLDKGD